MKVIQAHNVHEALPAALHELRHTGYDRDSRNGPVRLFPTPVTTVYQNPLERVIFWPERDANPFFHFFEALWMLAGRNDLAFPAHYAANIRSYSDDGKTLHGAYGHRWRNWFGHDQLGSIVQRLRADPNDRRAVLGMWDASVDLERDGKDVPCNTQAFFAINGEGELDMTVLNRSNDMVWGCYGANAVHFSMLQEYLALAIGVPVGIYYQVSNNLHAYHSTLKQVERLASVDARAASYQSNPYMTGCVAPFPMRQTTLTEWEQDLNLLLTDGPIVGFRDPFFRRVAVPMWMAHRAYKEGKVEKDRFDRPIEILDQCLATDWRRACIEWIERRRAKWQRAQDGGVHATAD
jgi:hypothetical protein